MLTGTERRGDYTGSQRRYNQNGVVWVSGEYAIANHTTRTWIAELSPDNLTAVHEPATDAEQPVLFPNPASERITIAFANTQNQQLVFSIFDTQGKLVKTLFRGAVMNGPNEFSFSASALVAGNYLLVIDGGVTGRVVAKSFVKN